MDTAQQLLNHKKLKECFNLHQRFVFKQCFLSIKQWRSQDLSKGQNEEDNEKILRKNQEDWWKFEERMRKVEALPTRFCEAGYDPCKKWYFLYKKYKKIEWSFELLQVFPMNCGYTWDTKNRWHVWLYKRGFLFLPIALDIAFGSFIITHIATEIQSINFCLVQNIYLFCGFHLRPRVRLSPSKIRLCPVC